MATYNINKLGQFELKLDRHWIGDILDRSDQLVVAGHDVIVQPLCIGVAIAHS